MRSYIPLFIFFVSVDAISAQTDSSNILYWGEKRLEWSDFQGSPISYSLAQSGLNYSIGYSTKSYYVDGVKVTAQISDCYMNRGTSWVKQESRTDAYLIYNQIQFDLAELYSRKLQGELFLLLNEKKDRQLNAATRLLEINLDCQQRITQFYQDTDYGRDTAAVKLWAGLITRELDETPRKKIPDLMARKFGVGFSIDLGGGVLTGSLNRYFSNDLSLACGLDITFLDFVCFLRTGLGFSHVKNELEYNNRIWLENLSVGISRSDLALGYTLAENNKSRITPFAGIGYIKFSLFNTAERYEKHRLGTYSYIIGMNYDYKNNTKINLLSRFHEKTYWFIRTRIDVVLIDFDDQLKGTVINFTVGLGGLVRFLRII
jgi:hypothetical protein